MRVREKNCNGGEFHREQNMLLVVGVLKMSCQSFEIKARESRMLHQSVT